MNATAVMQHATHAQECPLYFVNTRGVLMKRRENRPSVHTGYSMEFNDATRSEMQILADLLNDPESKRRIEAGWPLHQAWAEAIEAHAVQLRAAA